jgi:signal transduction histidine kinase
VARRSIGFPLAVGVVLLLLVLALAVGWQVLLVSDIRAASRGLSSLDWVLLVAGGIFFLLVIVGLVWLCAWLVREMRTNQRQRAFLDAVTHEMRTPLASLRLYLDTMVRHDAEPAERRQFLARMHADVERLDRTVEQVLTAARAEEPGRRVTLGVVPLSELLGECIEEIRAHHGLPAAAVRLDGVDAAVRGDATELGVVFRNLLENAVKYSEDPVEVKVRVEPLGEERVRSRSPTAASESRPGASQDLPALLSGRARRAAHRRPGPGLFIVRNLVRRQGAVKAAARGAGGQPLRGHAARGAVA